MCHANISICPSRNLSFETIFGVVRSYRTGDIKKQAFHAKSKNHGAHFSQILKENPELAGLIKAWPEVSAELRAAILKMIT